MRYTFELPIDYSDDIVPVVVTVYREADGEIRLHESRHHRAADTFEQSVTDHGGQVLTRVEGEQDLSTGDASIYVRH